MAADCLSPVFCVFFIALVLAGCAHHRPIANPPVSVPPAEQPTTAPPQQPVPAPTIGPSPAPAVQYTEQGVASWYGVPFNGRRTSDGEIYNMFTYTAAHRTLPFGAVVRVTNLNNGRQVEVRINDRGPFVANRIIDLSYSAAVAIGMIGTGTASVRLAVVGGPDPNVGFFGVQVGAFSVESNAERLRDRLSAQYSPVTITQYDSPNGMFYRVRAGRFTTQNAAQQLAQQLEERDQFVAFVVRLDN